MTRKLLNAIAFGALMAAALPTAGVTGALASDSSDRPTYGECTAPAPNPPACDSKYSTR